MQKKIRIGGKLIRFCPEFEIAIIQHVWDEIDKLFRYTRDCL